MNKSVKTTAFLLMIVIFALLIYGCGCFNKGSMTYSRHTTTGQELLDLKEAKDSGAISEEEYEKLRKNVMKEDCKSFPGFADKK